MAARKTLNELIYEIYETLNILADDTDVQYLWVATLICDRRVKWLAQENNKNRAIDPALIQVLPCVELIDVDVAECCSVITDCYVKRTKEKIPNFIQLHWDKLITQVTPVGVVGNLPFQPLTREMARWFGFSPFEKNAIGYFYLNDYLYFVTRNPDNVYFTMLEKVRIEGVFENPIAVGDMLTCDDKPCWTFDSEFPIGVHMWSWIKEDILKLDLRLKLSSPEDTQGNNTDDVIPDK